MSGGPAADGQVLAPEEGIAEFERDYANTKRLASERGTGARWLAQALRARGIRPAYEHLEGDRATVVIWRRKDIPGG